MDPSTEQLIRDYLNRLAVAARSSMGTDELLAFLTRMRDSIERQCAAYGGPSPAEVRSALAVMGEPKALVAREHARLAAAQGGLDAGSRYAAGWPATATATDSSAGPSAVTTDRPAVTTDRPAVTTGILPGAQGAGDTAAGSSDGRLLRIAGKPRRYAGRRNGQPSADTGPGADPGSAPTDRRQAVQRRPVTARRKPAEVLIDRPAASKNAVRPRGPQGRDSPVLLPLKQNNASWQDPPAGPGQRATQPEPAEQPRAALTFVMEPPPDPQDNVVAPPKFQPVREPAGWPASSPGRRRGPEQDLERGPEQDLERGPEQDLERGPEQDLERGPEQDLGRGPEQDLERGPEQSLEPGPEQGMDGPERRPGPASGGLPRDGRPRRRAVVTGMVSSRRERIATGLSVFIQRAPGLARQHPLECVVVILLGLGGLIYPPVWLLGALAALPSRLWDVKDKLTGLAIPAVVAIVGGAGLAMGSSHASGGAYFHEALIIGGYLIRAGSVLGGGYLAWRVQRGQRRPAEPPWRRQYR
jgi:hypothetical protein